MRKFSSYGPIDTELHYYAPRTALIDRAMLQLVGEIPNKDGHYITVWAPRQCGKTWVMQQVVLRLRNEAQYNNFDVVVLSLEHLKREQDVNTIVGGIAQEILADLGLEQEPITDLKAFHHVFKKEVLQKPLILILDEFDALPEDAISGIAGVLRNIYNSRQYETDKSSAEKKYLLHGVALIGVRSVLGIENVTGSPFNVQRSLHVPNLTFAEAESMFKWYEQESGQQVEPAVVEQVYYETQGQPGLTCWLGELLTETYNKQNPTITRRDFEIAYAAAVDALPNANILNIISKARQEPYQELVWEMFQTNEKIPFRYDDPRTNFLYMNGVVDQEIVDETKRYLKFACPFVQKRLFNYFSYTLFRYLGKLYEPFENLEDTITENQLNVKNLLKRYERYLKQNRDWLFKDAPRRADFQIYEAVYHFTLYMYLASFLQHRRGQVFPEFPTGNGKIDLLIRYAGQMYGLELKTFTDLFGYREALEQAARYGQQLGLREISLVFFVSSIDETNREKYETVYIDQNTKITVVPIFIETAN
ncbi:ATP-binding protein [Candidatus Poribacteria bacterium]|nr:ATP-binding protein [Candidatus Poribacteria bacterium]